MIARYRANARGARASVSGNPAITSWRDEECAAVTALSIREQFLGAIAFAGDLSMGQPPEHSPATAILAARLATEAGTSAQTQSLSAQLAMIRWAGCTANAREFADLLGDDVRGRAELLADRNPFVAKEPPAASLHGVMVPLATIHCEAAAEIARRANLDRALITAVGDLFENWDGSGLPRGVRGEDIDQCAQFVSLASDLEIFSRCYGPARAVMLIEARGGRIYPADLALRIGRDGPNWLSDLPKADLVSEALNLCSLRALNHPFDRPAAIRLLADYADLKRPERTGAARKAGRLAGQIARHLGLTADARKSVEEAALLSGLGFVAVANTSFATSGRVDAETLRLAPHWTERILSRAPEFSEIAKLASMAFERLDGSGRHRGLTASALSIEARIVQLSIAAIEFRLTYPPHTFRPQSDLRSWLETEVAAGRLDAAAARAALHVLGAADEDPGAEDHGIPQITARERDVLGLLIRGLTNKAIARDLDLSPKTVSTHLEHIYAKLGVSTRAAAAIKALDRGLF
ncbi:MAG: HD domain-containing phosphohydrolase [Pseudomonadota bacterium]